MTKQYRGGRWSDFPSQPDEDALWGGLDTGTKKDTEDLYGPILKVFEDAIEDSKK